MITRLYPNDVAVDFGVTGRGVAGWGTTPGSVKVVKAAQADRPRVRVEAPVLAPRRRANRRQRTVKRKTARKARKRNRSIEYRARSVDRR